MFDEVLWQNIASICPRRKAFRRLNVRHFMVECAWYIRNRLLSTPPPGMLGLLVRSIGRRWKVQRWRSEGYTLKEGDMIWEFF